MSSPKGLAAALAAAGLLALGAASPAAAQNIANPVGTAFTGFNTTVFTWGFGGGANAQCTNVTPIANAAPRGVTANSIGGPSTRMARFRPIFAGCSATIGGMAFGASVTANCDWAHAVDLFNAGTGASIQRLQLGIACPNPLNAVTIDVPGAGCTIGLHQQPLIDNGANISIAGQDGPWPPPPNSMRVANGVTGAIARTASGCAGVANPNPPASMNGEIEFNNVWAGP